MAQPCKVKDCKRMTCPKSAKGMCRLHYQRHLSGYHNFNAPPHRSEVSSEHYKSGIYMSWSNMKSRCDNPKATHYADYGGRGISYASEWSSFDNFYKDMSEGHRDGLTLERIDVNADYSPINCKWIARSEQANNKRNSRLITIDGITHNLTQWAKLYGLKPSTVRQRYYTYGWPVARALGLGGQDIGTN